MTLKTEFVVHSFVNASAQLLNPQYGREVAPHLERVGAHIVYGGVAPYPSPAAFFEMVSSVDYAEVHEHRAAALTRGDLIHVDMVARRIVARPSRLAAACAWTRSWRRYG
ncbi:hypothetical protein [Mycobacterium angelicum]|uniref:DUF1330 domain-containing protein n=1 Tax=Mycobacterium angelicum TaxID=470074 RepID=A0A1W9ZY19_MYCAN|nr:hypothetical protein [Mycobacterium angelicum]MCV7198065.1 hypothetical protein [Mycobacterium angelicum]ORA22693.1 hypothetical protein BST12_08945 [Mycobacterium angelicum]